MNSSPPIHQVLEALPIVCVPIVIVFIVYCISGLFVNEHGYHEVKWARRWSLWSYCRDYFPARLIKTADLDPQRNHLICLFPHGVWPIGACLSLLTESNCASQVFPGICFTGITLKENFQRPLLREAVTCFGVCSATQKNLNRLLSDPGGGRAAVLAVGGTAEMLLSKPNVNEVVLKERKGFIKLALRNGASLVPAYSFGETDMYELWPTPEGSWLRWVQDATRKYIGYTLLFPKGPGIFQYFYWIVPRRCPIHTVVGKPIYVDKVAEPTDEQINELHEKFVISLRHLFEEEKHKYLEDADEKQLVII